MPPHSLCIKCGKPLSCEKNGILVRFSSGGGGVKADLFKCPRCGFEVALGFGADYQVPHENYEEYLDKMHERGLLYDYSKSEEG